MAADINAIVEQVKQLTVLELNELVKALEEEFGVSAAAAVAVSGAGAGAEVAAAEEEKTEFDVLLKSPGAQKIGVIKVVREILPGLGLVEAKGLVDSAPKVIKEGVDKATAEEMATKLRAAGAEVEIN